MKEELTELISLVQENQRQFELILANCNYPDLRQKILEYLLSNSRFSIETVKINPNEIHLLSAIKAQLNCNPPQALTVTDLEKVNRIDELLKIANQVREEFQNNFHYPVIIWVTDIIAQKFIKIAPDFYSWGQIMNFTKTLTEITERLREKADELFAQALTTGDGYFISPENILSHDELEASRRDLTQNGEKLEPDLEACIVFIQAREFYTQDKIDRALKNYQKSINLWKKVVDNQQEIKLKKGVIFSNIGLCYLRKAELHRAEAKQYWQKAKKYFQECIESFKSTDKEDLIAKYINQLAEVLLKLEQWNELQELAQKAIQLFHKNNPRELAQDYVFLAEVALSNQQWVRAEKLSRKVLKILENYHEKVISYRASFILSRSLESQVKIPEAINILENIAENKLQENPQLYINILGKLRSLLLQEYQYSQAFHIKKKLRTFEYEYGFRAFIGAEYLRPQKPQSQVRDVPLRNICSDTGKTELNSSEYIDHLIETSGQKALVEKLLNRLSDTRHKLTIIYGKAGVGKSSMIHSALIPALKGKIVETRDFITVLINVFDDWKKQLAQALYNSLKDKKITLEPILYNPNNISDLIKILKHNEDNHIQTVIIFDQFEDIFFVDQKTEQRNVAKNFFEFLSQCLDLPFIKIILSLREDYLHKLSIGSRSVKLKAINNDILSKDNLCYLENFTPSKYVNHVIETYGRRSLVEKLLSRLSDTRHKLTIIYGQSGVSKSSLIQSALIPALKGKNIDTRNSITVLIDVFDNWETKLGQALYHSLNNKGINLEYIPNNISDLIKILKHNEDNYIQTVMIFDQFENIFFIDQKIGQKNVAKKFFEFLSQCLDLPFIKIILSVREDYLYYLLMESRSVKLGGINNDILGKDNICYLENFKPEEAKSVIKTLTDRSQFQLELELVDRLVKDLAEPDNEVRPIELQIVGSALQDMGITNLERYYSLGHEAKEKLIECYLDAVFEDCGLENKQTVLTVLEALIDEQHHDKKRRLTKSQIQFATNLNYLDKKLELILDILAGNNIIFRFPFDPDDQYQIVHDYLIYPIKQKINAEKDRTTEITLLQQLLYQLRTPLASMVGLSEMLSDDGVDFDSPESNEALRKISITGKLTIEQLSDILDLYQLESGSLKLYPESFNIDHIVKEVIDTIKATKPQLPLMYKPKLLGSMTADLTRVRQCFRNLLSNAVNLSQGFPITLDIQRKTHDDKQWIVFCVKSAGIKLSQTQIEELLQTTTQNKSNQPEASRTAQQLTITKKLCQLMGGRFQITNPQGKSVSFIMEIPC